MASTKIEKLPYFLSIILILLTWAIWPNHLTNPTVTPKAWILSAISLASCFLLVLKLDTLNSKSARKTIANQTKQNFVKSLLIFFIFSLLVSTIKNLTDLNWKLFGSEERRTGFFYYLGLILLGILIAKADSPRLSFQTFFRGLSISNLGVSTYAILQSLGFELFSFATFYESSSSFLGNPNLVSGFVGMSCWAHFWILNVNNSLKRKILTVMYLLTSFLANAFVLYQNGSLSGPFAVVVATLAVLLLSFVKILFMHNSKIKQLKKSITRFVALFLSIPLMLAPIILTFETFRDAMLGLGGGTRLAYWNVSLKMFFDDPLFGKGPEPFSSYFLRFRQPQDLKYIGLKQNVDSPHSLPLEILNVGGLFLFLPFAIFVVISVYSASKAYLLETAPRNFDRDPEVRNYLILCLLILGFIAQSIVNVSNVAISAWGITLIALSMQLYLQSGEPDSSIKGFPRKNSLLMTKFNNFALKISELIGITWVRLSCSLISVFILLFSFTGHTRILVNEIAFKNAVAQKNGQEMIEISGKWPEDERRILGVAFSLENAQLHSQSLPLLKQGVVSFPNSIQMWILLERNPLLDMETRLKATRAILKIDPLYKDK